jgi:hypothetical protein
MLVGNTGLHGVKSQKTVLLEFPAAQPTDPLRPGYVNGAADDLLLVVGPSVTYIELCGPEAPLGGPLDRNCSRSSSDYPHKYLDFSNLGTTVSSYMRHSTLCSAGCRQRL